MKTIILILTTFMSLSLYSQEICDNGIDDDGDGLIDLNDTDCSCSATGGLPSSLIPNPSFEDHSCLPSNFSQLSCADSWVQATDATSDYFYDGSYVFNGATSAGLVPFPDGSGAVGAIFSPGYQEYIGSCLTTPMIAGTQYTLQINIASTPISDLGDVCNGGIIDYGDIDITIFGNPDCSELPYSTNGCPGGNWYVLTTISYTPESNWDILTFNFTPTANVGAIMIGAPCTVPASYSPPSGCYPYFYFDNLILNESTAFNPVSVTETGNVCTNNLVLSATASGSGVYQWYYEGAAIVGQTNQTLNVSTNGNGDGTYQVTYTDIGGCSMGSTVVTTPVVTAVASADQSICQGTSATISASGGVGYLWDNGLGTVSSANVSPNTTTTYNVTATDADGCTDTDEVTITVNPNPTPTITGILSICAGMSTNLDAGAGYANYSWSPAGSSQGITANVAGNYSVTVTDTNGCMGTDMVTVTENPSLTPNITGTLAICDGENTILDAGTGYANYAWSNSGVNQTINVGTAGNYSVTVTDINGCTGSDQVTVDVQSVSTTITGNLGICEGQTTTLDAGAGQSHYLWNTGASTQTLTVSSEGSYSVTVSNDIGCTAEDHVTVIVDYLNLIASSDKLICDGASANLAASLTSGGIPPFTYYWDTGENTSNIIVSPTTQTIYSVYLTDAFGCVSNTENITVSVNPPVSFDVSTNKDTVCPGDPVLITSTATSGKPPYTITDSDNNIINIENIVYPYQQQTYSYTVTDACGSTQTDMVTINTYDVPALNIQADVLYGCEPLSVNFITTQNSDNNFYTWTFDSGSNSEVAMGAEVLHIFENFGLYDVEVSVISDDGCKNSMKVNDLIDVYRSPEPHFLTNPQTVSIVNPEVNFKNLSEWADNYVWSFGDGDTSNMVNPYHRYDEIGSYVVRLLAITNEGCIDSVMQQIIVENEPTIYVPTAFSPDGDDINDLFEVKANGIDLDNYSLKVYDRGGEVIFESNDLFKSWDGKAKGLDKYVENGTYIWFLKVNYENGIEYEKSGSVTVIR